MNHLIMTDSESILIPTKLTKEHVLEALQFLKIPFSIKYSEEAEVFVSVSSTEYGIQNIIEAYLNDYVLRQKILARTSIDVEKLINRIIEKSLGR
jgi:hypothetical protein